MTHPVSDSEHSYARGALIFADAADGFDLVVNQEQVYEWETTLKVVHELDGILDGPLPKEERDEQVLQLTVDILDGNNMSQGVCADKCSFCELQDLATGWNDEKRYNFGRVIQNAAEISDLRRHTTRATHLGRLAVIDGQGAAELFMIPPTLAQPTEKFNTWLGHLVGAGTAIDCAIDLREDFDNRLTKVKPTLTNRSLVAAMGVPLLLKTCSETKLRVAESLVSALSAMVQDKGEDQRALHTVQ